MADRSLVGRLWWSEARWARLARTLLRPAAGLYGGTMRARKALYDAGVMRTRDIGMPSVAVGNLSVGGTGKTPIAAWIASKLRERGELPGILLRGYGDDEPLVHAVLNPGIPVVASPDRIAGARRAQEQGATIVVLDDAFQHHGAHRDADVVLVSADAWRDRHHLLPAGPWREPLRSLRRADLVVVTRKAVTRARADAVDAILQSSLPGITTAIVALMPDALRGAIGGEDRSLSALAGEIVLGVAAIGEPVAFMRQLEQAGANVHPVIFPDHHRFTAKDALKLAKSGEERGGMVVCTLKDAVKLAPLWPRAARPLWYVSQRVVFERGEEMIDDLLDDVLSARTIHSSATPASERP